MKIHVGNPQTQFIGGYNAIQVVDEQIDLSAISDNECVEILASEILDEFQIHNIGQVIQLLLSKLRIGGKLIIGGTDVLLFCKAVQDGSISEQDYCNIISSKKSMTQTNIVLDTLRQLGLTIEVSDINGIHFEATVRR
jgi:hypothetical protein